MLVWVCREGVVAVSAANANNDAFNYSRRQTGPSLFKYGQLWVKQSIFGAEDNGTSSLVRLKYLRIFVVSKDEYLFAGSCIPVKNPEHKTTKSDLACRDGIACWPKRTAGGTCSVPRHLHWM